MHTKPKITIRVTIPLVLFNRWQKENNLILSLLTDDQLTTIEKFVVENLDDQDGGPQIKMSRISNFEYHEGSRRGSFRLHFYVDRLFCCSDIESSRQDYMDFNYSYIDEILSTSATYFDWNLL